jgi:hypothetical protein
MAFHFIPKGHFSKNAQENEKEKFLCLVRQTKVLLVEKLLPS